MSVRAADAVQSGNYRIQVEDFGPIIGADVDLRPLTVFAGPSNTGKSYLAMLVYALQQCFGPSYLPATRIRQRSFWFAGSMFDSLPDRGALTTGIMDWLSSSGDDERAALPDDLAAAFRPALEQVAGVENHLAQEVRRCFGVDMLEALVRRDSAMSYAAITLQVPQKPGVEQVRYRFEIGPRNIEVTGQVTSPPRLSRDMFDDSEYLPGLFDLEERTILLRSVLDAMFRSVMSPVIRPTYYLPADRTGVMHSHQVVVSTLIQSATTAGLRPSANVPMLSGVLADFLDGLIGMSRPQRRSSRIHADVLEKNLLAGAIRLRRSETGYPSFAYRPATWDADLPLMRTSSMVSELAPVVLYLRYLVRRGDLLIIEEPESHLHPAMQAAFARELARLVRSGLRIMLTTHSEWIVEALANLVRLSELPKTERKGIPGGDVALTPDQVGAWLFKPGVDGTGSTVDEITLDLEAGNYPAGFGEVTESLYNEWVGISNRIEAAKANPKE